ncbi:uncharacterized protein [Drosophila takahashii]|uniref:uncharacterized protein n=1 Tax=Drosophila takahashii TaxID=29030 RepID=UPI003898F1CA
MRFITIYLETYDEVDADVTKALKSYLENFTGHWKDNTEFLNWIAKIRSGVKNNNTQLAEKFQLQYNFESYNAERLILEENIEDRIEELDSIIPHQKHQKCLQFYVEQRNILKKALKQSNKQKIEKFGENSIHCPYYHFDINEYLKPLEGIANGQKVR